MGLFLWVAIVGDLGYLSIKTPVNAMVFWHYHLAVLVASVLVGASLGIVGAILQVMLKNPLADASVLGVSSGSQFFGIALLILFQYVKVDSNTFGFFFMACILGAMSVLAVFLLVLLLQSKLSNIAVIILLGVGISAIFSALTALVMSFSNSAFLQQVVMWQFGGFSSVSWPQDILLLVCLVIFFVFAYKRHMVFDMFALGEKEAVLMGVNIKMLFSGLLILLSLLIAATVAIAGPIGFIGLVSPHIARMLLKTNKMWYLLPASMCVGGIVMLVSQYIATTILYPLVIPVGIITALIGAPFLIVLVVKQLSK
ncbi:FecCD family ABC transporter permease [Facilibium subflavum]|uniref:FecCD family ABC transporter permease n=1 Tax=Facilibium subflavum TaxID=2219058 RepID=UPI0013C362EE|nr:iron ABC transporter permease [Facilibium subflavum]